MRKQGTDEQEADTLIEQLLTDYRQASVNDVDRAMLDYAAKLTQGPSLINANEIQALRDQGLDDRAIHDLCAIVAYFAFANRIADGLGIELE
ncbi:MAG: hypothetical protein ACR2NP_15580 [Pirellulaceae bacterium]